MMRMMMITSRPLLVVLVLFIATVATSSTEAAASLRRPGASEALRLLEQSPEPSVQGLVTEKRLTWQKTGDSHDYVLGPEGRLTGDEAILVFHDRQATSAAKDEAALVSFDIRSSANCVVSVCGTTRRWYLGSKEQCWDLKVAPKSPDAEVNGVIRGIRAAYTADRPVASKMYLKFDAVNYIDGSACEYEVLSGSKSVTPMAPVATS